MDCKCGHYQYAHNFGDKDCAVKGCNCKRFKPKKEEESNEV